MSDRPTKQDDIDYDRYLGVKWILRRLDSQLEGLMEDDVKTARWLMRRIEAIARDAQKRGIE